MSGPPYYPHVYRPAGHEASPYQPAASAAISPPMSQGRLPYSSGASGVYHPAGVVVTAPGPAPSHHDVRWQQAVAAAAAAAAAPSPYSVRSTPRSGMPDHGSYFGMQGLKASDEPLFSRDTSG
ncbi:uncharacterized protein LOC122389959 [Amphibalanus amphitrite]|uniref:uncharacterized protein LOC122389959 n=1 Tax=Amphibalanus amphitrite TaxID=1232801 RepID=UPI001C8FBCD0|nr:uncharacterized protein LOC122389959 [Amphibalanus amphitrite]